VGRPADIVHVYVLIDDMESTDISNPPQRSFVFSALSTPWPVAH
jgi:hypothetical protein